MRRFSLLPLKNAFEHQRFPLRHDSSVQCVAYHPTSNLLASCSNSDFGLWSPEQKNVTKTKLTGRITCCAWSADGQSLAFGLYNGQVHIRDKVRRTEQGER